MYGLRRKKPTTNSAAKPKFQKLHNTRKKNYRIPRDEDWNFCTSKVKTFTISTFIKNLFALLFTCATDEQVTRDSCFVVRMKDYTNENYSLPILNRVRKSLTGKLEWFSYHEDPETGMMRRKLLDEKRTEEEQTVEKVFMDGLTEPFEWSKETFENAFQEIQKPVPYAAMFENFKLSDGCMMSFDISNMVNPIVTYLNRSGCQEIMNGISAVVGLIGRGFSSTALHVEDLCFSAVNIMLFGAPKIWVVIPTSHYRVVTDKIREFYPEERCPNFFRNKDFLPHPSQLKAWNIPFTLIEQRPGDLVCTLGSAFHYVIGSGFSISEAVNIAFPGIDDAAIQSDSEIRCTCPITKDVRDERKYTGNQVLQVHGNDIRGRYKPQIANTLFWREYVELYRYDRIAERIESLKLINAPSEVMRQAVLNKSIMKKAEHQHDHSPSPRVSGPRRSKVPMDAMMDEIEGRKPAEYNIIAEPSELVGTRPEEIVIDITSIPTHETMPGGSVVVHGSAGSESILVKLDESGSLEGAKLDNKANETVGTSANGKRQKHRVPRRDNPQRSMTQSELWNRIVYAEKVKYIVTDIGHPGCSRKKYTCQKCHREFQHRANARMHCYIHYVKYSCKKCQKIYKSKTFYPHPGCGQKVVK